MDGTEVMYRGISLSFGRASNRHCSRLTLEIGTNQAYYGQRDAVRGRSVRWINTDVISVNHQLQSFLQIIYYLPYFLITQFNLDIECLLKILL